MLRRVKRLCVAALVGVVICIGAGGVSAWILLTGSLARESGGVPVEGLSGEVEVSRDARGVARIRGETPEDVARGLGFVHAQERFFQMDAMRRSAAGELAELVGSGGLARDRVSRTRRFRAVSVDVLARLPEAHRRLLEAYTQGVNAGLADLSVRPPEYLVLRAEPSAWRAEDSLLVMFTMFDMLSGGEREERVVDALRAALPEEMAEFLTPETTRFDAPLTADARERFEPARIPESAVMDLRAELGIDVKLALGACGEGPEALGSNNWAVAGSRTKDGRAILANDMHLALMAPNTWFRAQLEWGEEAGAWRAVGVTLAGVPAMVAGSNGHVAWGFTNVGGDFEDLIVVEEDPEKPGYYLTPEGSEPYGVAQEDLRVLRGAPERLTLKTTRWGVVSGIDARRRPTVLKWSAQESDKVNLAVIDMLEEVNLDGAMQIASRWYGPPQNVVIADSTGRVGWVMSGWHPKREGYDGRAPVSWGTSGVGWVSARDDEGRPRLADPADGVVFSANQRMLPLAQSRMFGWGWSPGSRAGRIAERLREQTGLDEAAMLALQLDTESKTMEFYRGVALRALAGVGDEVSLVEVRELITQWNGRADADQAGFRLLELMRGRLRVRILGPLVEACRTKDEAFRYSWFQWDEPLMRLLEERPAHLLAAEFADWDAAVIDALEWAIKAPAPEAGAGIRTGWGAQNRSRISHMLSLAVPALGAVLDMPRDPLPGHGTAVRVQGRTFGASERLVVSPGREEDGILHMPCGQSGHFLSKHYSDGHADWVAGRASPLLAGEAVSAFRLVPQR